MTDDTSSADMGLPAAEKPQLKSAGSSSTSPPTGIDPWRLKAKIDWRVVPVVTLLYLLSFLDRSNVGNARIEGLTTSIHITGDQYLTGLTLYFIGYVLFEVPFNIVLKRSTPKLCLPTFTIIWGIVATLQGIIVNEAGYFAVRFFLGLTECGLFPGVLWYLSMWYTREERQTRVALFFSAASLAGAFGGILAWAIAHMNGVGGLAGWRWIFILEGLLTIVVAVPAYLLVTNWPSSASWLSLEEQAYINAKLKADCDATNVEGFTWQNVLAAFKDYRCWLYGLLFHTTSLPLYTLSLFLPSIISALGYSSATAQLLTIPPYAVACILTYLTAYASQRLKIRAPFMIAHSLIGVIGYSVLLANKHPKSNPAMSYVGVFFAASGIYPFAGLAFSWQSANVSGQTKRAVSSAMQISIGNLGAIMGTQLYRPEWAPRYIQGHAVALVYMFASAVVVAVTWYLLDRENKRRDRIQSSASAAIDPDAPFEGDQDVRWRFMV